MAYLKHYLVFEHIKIHDANTISSPITYGFPSINGFVGAIHALSRKIESEQPIYLDGVLIACHDCDVQVFRPHDFADYTFNLTRNPLSNTGKTRPIIEEGKVHLDVTLIVEVKVSHDDLLADEESQHAFMQQMETKLKQQRIAGGFVESIGNVSIYSAFSSVNDLIKPLLPAYVLAEAQNDLQLITSELQKHNPDATSLDALLETAMLHHIPIKEDKWQSQTVKSGRGWLVPIHLGYQGISPVFAKGSVQDVRSKQHQTQYVEAVYGLGKWVFPLQLYDEFTNMFWRYQPTILQSNNSELYIVSQNNAEY